MREEVVVEGFFKSFNRRRKRIIFKSGQND